jgi:hypothetical protein
LICRKRSSENQEFGGFGFDFYVNKIYYQNKKSDKQSKLLLLRERALEHASAYPVSNSSLLAVSFFNRQRK